MIIKTSHVLLFAAASTHDYYMKVVPTVFETSSGQQYFPYQYTFAQRVSFLINFFSTFIYVDIYDTT